MKLDCGLTFNEKIAAWKEWHPWFAWRPVRVGHRDCRWLEWVERRREYNEYYHGMGAQFLNEYRELKQ